MKLPSTVRQTAAALARAALTACAVMGALAAAPAQAVDVYVRVERFNQPIPGGQPVAMWGYAVGASAAEVLRNSVKVSSPGPAIDVPPGDTTLRIHLLNRLPVPTSIVLHGQNAAMAPVYKSNATVNDPTTTSDCVPGTTLDCRVRSFTHETPPGNATAVVYEFTGVKPGTYLYQSGTLPQIQVQMGLYGMMRKDAAATSASFNAYPDVPYDDAWALLLSEIDPAFHAAVASGTFAGSTLAYDPKFFRVHLYGTGTNAEPVDVTASQASNNIVDIKPGRRLLMRMLNAGLKSRSMVLDDGHWYVMAEDGNKYPFPREQYSVFLPAAKTADVWMTPTVGDVSKVDRLMTVFDRTLGLTNNNAQPVGGMLFQMRVGDLKKLPTLNIANCPLGGSQGELYTCPITASGAGTRFSLDIAPVGMGIDPASGVITWLPTNDQAQRPADPTVTNPLRVRAVDASGGIAVSPIVRIAVANVNDAPLALNDAYTVRGGALTVVNPLLGVRANDSDPDGDALGNVSQLTPLAPAAVGDALTLNADGTFAFTTTDITTDRVASFTYQVTDVPLGQPALPSNSGVVTLNIKANVAPTARDDMVAMLFTSGGTIDIDVLANDFDLDNNIFEGSLAIFAQPNCGGSAIPLPGAGPGGRPLIRYTLPANRTNCGTTGGTDTLTYTVSDTQGLTSTPAFVRINIQ